MLLILPAQVHPVSTTTTQLDVATRDAADESDACETTVKIDEIEVQDVADCEVLAGAFERNGCSSA